jgi:ribosomal protein S18 acetylase RimI-like enzyme
MSEGAVVIDEITDLTTEFAAEIWRLLPQLSTSATKDDELLARVIDSPTSSLLVARVDGRMVGMCTLATILIPTGVRARIEDVVVDESARGQGIGSELIMAAVRLAKTRGARNVDLTSRPSRSGANRLYQRLGFEVRDTNVYRFDLQR